MQASLDLLQPESTRRVHDRAVLFFRICQDPTIDFRPLNPALLDVEINVVNQDTSNDNDTFMYDHDPLLYTVSC